MSVVIVTWDASLGRIAEHPSIAGSCEQVLEPQDARTEGRNLDRELADHACHRHLTDTK